MEHLSREEILFIACSIHAKTRRSPDNWRGTEWKRMERDQKGPLEFARTRARRNPIAESRLRVHRGQRSRYRVTSLEGCRLLAAYLAARQLSIGDSSITNLDNVPGERNRCKFSLKTGIESREFQTDESSIHTRLLCQQLHPPGCHSPRLLSHFHAARRHK